MKIHIILPICLLILGTVSMAAGMDDADLKDWLVNNFLGYEGLSREDADDFKKRFAVKDEQFHRVLMDIYHEAENSRAALAPGTQEWEDSQRIESGLIELLPLCFHPQVKDFLKNYVDLKAIDSIARGRAVLSYLIVANAEESENILLRFLVGEERTDLERLSVYSFARIAYDESASLEKKATILAALVVAANKEEEKIRFMKADGILAERSTAYRKSRERLAMLERHSLEPPTANIYTDRDLKAALSESRKYKDHTTINTNLAVLAEHTFNLPQTNGLKKGASVLVSVGADNEEEQPAPLSARSLRLAIPFATVAGLLAMFALWRGIRSKKP